MPLIQVYIKVFFNAAAIRQTPMAIPPFTLRQFHPFPQERIRHRPIVGKSGRD
jgi:hypothetical protein